MPTSCTISPWAAVVEVSQWAHQIQDHVLNGSFGMVLPTLRNTSLANVLLTYLGDMSFPLQLCRMGKASFLFSVRHTLHFYWGLCTVAHRVCTSPLALPGFSKGTLWSGIGTKERLLCPVVSMSPWQKLLEAFDGLAGCPGPASVHTVLQTAQFCF